MQTYTSSAQLTGQHSPAGLENRLVMTLINFPRKQIGKMMSDCRVVGVLPGVSAGTSPPVYQHLGAVWASSRYERYANSCSKAIQYKRKGVDKEPEYSVLWMFLLLEVLGPCTDARPEVRIGTIQTLFRAMQLCGASLSLETWEECIWKVTIPLLDPIATKTRLGTSSSPPSSPAAISAPDATAVPPDQAWDESETLALQSIGSILHDFLVLKIMRLDSFTKT
jgi:hypothetical protein